MASKSTERAVDEDVGPDIFQGLLQALQTCARGDRDYQLFFEASAQRLDVLRGVLLCTDRDGNFQLQVSKACSRAELAECIFRELRRLNPRRADEFADFVNGAASVDDQKRLWTLLLETAAYAQSKRSSSSRKSHDLTFEQPATSSLPPRPLAKVEPEGGADDISEKSSASGRPPHLPSSSSRGLVMAASGEEMVIAAGGGLDSFGEYGCGDVRSQVSSQCNQIPDKKVCEEFLEAKRNLCLAAEKLVEGVEARLAADAPQRPMIDFDGTAVKKIHDAICNFELLTGLVRDDK